VEAHTSLSKNVNVIGSEGMQSRLGGNTSLAVDSDSGYRSRNDNGGETSVNEYLKLILISLVIIPVLSGCRATGRYADASDRILQMHRAHGGIVWEGWPTLAFELEVDHGPNHRIQKFHWHKPTGQIRFDENYTGTVMAMDDKAGWIHPAVREDADPPSRAYLQYIGFLMGAPFLASGRYDSSKRIWQGRGMGKELRFVRVNEPTMTKDVVVGVATLGINEDSKKLQEMSYVLSAPYLTPANTQPEEWPRRLVRYSDFRNVQGMTLAHSWELYDFERNSDTPKWVGSVRVRELSRKAPHADIRFLPPEDSRIDESFHDKAAKQ
jgi:hypothetical protein